MRFFFTYTTQLPMFFIVISTLWQPIFIMLSVFCHYAHRDLLVRHMIALLGCYIPNFLRQDDVSASYLCSCMYVYSVL